VIVRRVVAALLGIAFVGGCLRAQGDAAQGVRAKGEAAPGTVAQGTGPAAARDLARGVELTAADIAGDSAAASRVGWITRRLIRAGEPLKEPAVAPAQLVHAGSEVTIRAESGGVIVTRTGTALSSGSLGERVRVRLDSQHTITGIVASPATVKVQ
jgi:flagella basal body P-ring formation protein FlgA